MTKKQLDMAKFISQQNVSLFGFLETKVKRAGLGHIYHNLCPYWCLTNNLAHYKGGLIVGWDTATLKVDMLLCTNQLIHLACQPDNGHPFYCSIVSCFNDKHERQQLIQQLGSVPCNGSWLVLGDFNCVANLDERLGKPVRFHEVLSLRQCMT